LTVYIVPIQCRADNGLMIVFYDDRLINSYSIFDISKPPPAPPPRRFSALARANTSHKKILNTSKIL
jgi:hypothetical protein